jgi:hypothetical protein
MWIILAILMSTAAIAEENWTGCKEAYEFCSRRPYHRDCRTWTVWGEPLTVFGGENPAATTDFCKASPWHMSCGSFNRHVICPIPK